MTERDVPEEVKAFISQYIHSVEQLDVLLLLRRSSARTWSIAEVAEELRTSDESAEKRLRNLADLGFVRSANGSGKDGFVYGPSNPSHDRLIGRVADLYPKWKYRIIDLIFSKPVDQMRALADAFRFRKGDQ